jgi:capsular exopolysaccharide synthesis family protein
VSRGQEVFLNPMSEVAEAYRTLRTALYFGVRDGNIKTLVVTSPTSGEGKSTLVSNLGISMAHAGRRTLIVDADFRRPVQHTIFATARQTGLSNVLNGTATLEEAIIPTDIHGLDLLPCGSVPARPSEMLNSERFATILATLGRHYDYVLLDSPPVTSVSDARILGAMCDATILVIRAGKSTRGNSVQARDSLLSVGAKLLGLVVNDVRGKDYHYTRYDSRYLSPRNPNGISLPGGVNGNGNGNGHANGNGAGHGAAPMLPVGTPGDQAAWMSQRPAGPGAGEQA